MHCQAQQVLPPSLGSLDIDAAHDRPWPPGHSNGGSIALLYTAFYPDRISGVVVLAPHVLVEVVSISAIQTTRTAYLDGNLRQRLQQYHDSADSASWG